MAFTQDIIAAVSTDICRYPPAHATDIGQISVALAQFLYSVLFSKPRMTRKGTSEHNLLLLATDQEVRGSIEDPPTWPTIGKEGWGGAGHLECLHVIKQMV